MENTFQLKKSAISGFALAALIAASAAIIPASYAGDGSGPKGQAGQSDQGQQGAGGQKGAIGGKGSGQGGPSGDSDAQGPRYGGGANSNRPSGSKGKPSWSQDALPADVELGRLSVARAPSHVLDKSLAEALATMDPSLYNLTSLTDILTAIKTGTLPNSTTTFVRVDSPLENLALYKDILVDGKIGDGSKITVTQNNTELLLAVFLGSASDKEIPITADTVTAVNTILKLTLPSNISAAELADQANQVRLDILAVHNGE